MKNKSHLNRPLLKAVLIGPLSAIPAMLIYVLFGHFFLSGDSSDLLLGLMRGLLESLLMLVYSYGFTIIYGIPIYGFLQKIKYDNIYTIVIAALVPATIFSVIQSDIEIFAMFGYFSIVVSSTCWVIVQRFQRSFAKPSQTEV